MDFSRFRSKSSRVNRLFNRTPSAQPQTQSQPQYKPPPNPPPWTPTLSQHQLHDLHNQVIDYQLTHASLINVPFSSSPTSSFSIQTAPISTTLFPTPFPLSLFNQAQSLQPILNQLYISISEDEEWLSETLKDLIEGDELTKMLWRLWLEVKEFKKGLPGDRNEAEVSCGVFRGDWMVDARLGDEGGLKQVEFNTYSVAGGVQSDRVGGMHRYGTASCVLHLPNSIDNDASSSSQRRLRKACQACC